MYRFAALIVVVCVIGCSVEPLKVGFCPTMAEAAHAAYPNAQLVLLDSSAIALAALREGDIDVAVIGRRAYSYESSDLVAKHLEPGFTLVAPARGVVSFEHLNELRIASVHEVNVSFAYERVSSKEEGFLCCDAVLISWDDFDDDCLLTVLAQEGKDEWFRAPNQYVIHALS